MCIQFKNLPSPCAVHPLRISMIFKFFPYNGYDRPFVKKTLFYSSSTTVRMIFDLNIRCLTISLSVCWIRFRTTFPFQITAPHPTNASFRLSPHLFNFIRKVCMWNVFLSHLDSNFRHCERVKRKRPSSCSSFGRLCFWLESLILFHRLFYRLKCWKHYLGVFHYLFYSSSSSLLHFLLICCQSSFNQRST